MKNQTDPGHSMGVTVRGHVLIKDDTGTTLLDKENAIHPQNMSRIFARALANEKNDFIYRMAFGNGGTYINQAQQISYKIPRDGLPPDSETYGSRLYNETYSEIVNESSPSAIGVAPELGTDPGSADSSGFRPGGGDLDEEDPASVEHISGPGVRSNELGGSSEVVVVCTLNPGEPQGQELSSDQFATEDPESDFMFDELGLYTEGAPAVSSAGYQQVDVGERTASDPSGLLPGLTYSFKVSVSGGAENETSFTVPAVAVSTDGVETNPGTGPNGEITYGDIAEAFNNNDPDWNIINFPGNVEMSITDDTNGAYPTIEQAQTYGYLLFQHVDLNIDNLGSSSTIRLSNGTSDNDFFGSINPSDGGAILAAVDGRDAGVANDPVNPSREIERLLAHLIFSPVLKSNDRTVTITYTLTITVARSESQRNKIDQTT